MSDPMTKVEIEDVLSSIRRLVSEDQTVPQGAATLRPEPSRPAAMHPRPVLSAAPVKAAEGEAEETTGEGDSSYIAPDSLQGLHAEEPQEPALDELEPEPSHEAQAQPDPLVLTPALRVVDHDSASLRASLEETIAELEAAISGSGGDWEPDGSEPDSPVEFDEFATSLAAVVSAGPAAVDDAGETEIGAAPEEFAAMDAGLDGAAQDDSSQDAEPAAEEASSPVADSPVRLVSDSGDARPEGLWSQYPETMEWSAPGDLTEHGAEGKAEGLELAPEEPETAALDEPEALAPEEPEALAPEQPDVLPGDTAADAYADPEPDLADRFWAAEAEDMDPGEPDFPEAARSDAPDWQDDPVPDNQPRRLHLAGGLGWGATPPISAAGRGWLRGEPEDTDLLEAEEDDEDGLFDDVEETVLDEVALRALVSEIIRQELQGTLGERITRSVRKLVRREIQRALASRDFE
ncbi:hypothetical protein [Frigidibacter albus]|nr:hypothetical protein [Frigidibacter albus]